MRRNLAFLMVAGMLFYSHLGQAGGRDVTDRARVKTIAGKWQMSNSKVVELTENVAFVKDFGEISMTFFKIDGLDASYSVVGNAGEAMLFLKFEGEGEDKGWKQLSLNIKSRDLLVTTAPDGTVAEWHRRHDDVDSTDYEAIQKLAGAWIMSEIEEGFNQLVFTANFDRDYKLPDLPHKVRFYKLSSAELGERLPLKSYSVLKLPDGERVLMFSAGDESISHFKFRLEGDVIILNERRFATRPVAAQPKEPARDKGTLQVRVAYGEVLGLTAAEFMVHLEGDESTGFLRREDGSGSSLMKSGYAYFGLLPQGKYRLSITGHFRKGNERVPFSMDAEYVFRGGTVVCEANISNGTFHCVQ